jgi:hypothetical protein
MLGGRPSSKGVSKDQMWPLLVTKHPVIGRESVRKGRVYTRSHTALSGPEDSPFCTLWGYYPSCGKGQRVNRLGLTQNQVTIQCHVYTQNNNMRFQHMVEIAVMRKVIGVNGHGVLLTNDKIRSSHGNITYDIIGVIFHSAFLLLKGGGLWVLCESLGSQMQAGVSLTMKVIGVNTPYVKRNDVTPLSSSGRMTSSKGSSGSVKVNACIWSLGSIVRGQCSGNNYPG